MKYKRLQKDPRVQATQFHSTLARKRWTNS